MVNKNRAMLTRLLELAVEADLRALFPKDDVLVTSHLEPETHEHDHPAASESAHDALTETQVGNA